MDESHQTYLAACGIPLMLVLRRLPVCVMKYIEIIELF